MCLYDPKSYARGGLPLVVSSVLDCWKMRGLTEDSPWPSRFFLLGGGGVTLSCKKKELITETGKYLRGS